MKFIIENWAALTTLFFALLRAAESFALASKTDKDNKFIETIKEFFRFG